MTYKLFDIPPQAASSKQLTESTVQITSPIQQQMIHGMAAESLHEIYHMAAYQLVTAKCVARVVRDDAVTLFVTSEIQLIPSVVGFLFWTCSAYPTIKELEQGHIHVTMVSVAPDPTNEGGLTIDLSNRYYLGVMELQTFFKAELALKGTSSNIFPLQEGSDQLDAIVLPDHLTPQ